MPSTVLVGTQWGDEGKGKITDLIAGKYDYVVRFQGGNNAGHKAQKKLTKRECYGSTGFAAGR